MRDERVEELVVEAVRLARGPGIADTVPSERERDRSLARERFLGILKESGLSRSAFAALLSCDEKALRLVVKGEGLPMPWWLETLLRERPELVANFAAELLRDVRNSLAAKKGAAGG